MKTMKTAARGAVLAVLLWTAAPAAQREPAQRDGLDPMAQDIAALLNGEAHWTDERRLQVSFRPARTTVQEGMDIYCGPLSFGLRDMLHKRVQSLLDDMLMSMVDVAVTDARAGSPPDVTLSWAWVGADKVRVDAHVLLADGRGGWRLLALLDPAELGRRERTCLFTFRPGSGEAVAMAAGYLREEPAFGEAGIVRRFGAGETFAVAGELSDMSGSGVVWSVVRWEDPETGKRRNVFTADLATRARVPPVGSVFRDCPHCPEMAVIPSGSFMMGSPLSEGGRNDRESPLHRVTVWAPFAVSVHEVTFDEWDACVSAGGCRGYRPDDEGWGRGRRPVINVSWYDARMHVAWLSQETGEQYRLLSESEWEYVARAGTQTRYWWGDDIGRNRADCAGCGSRWDNESTAPAGSFAANAFGLHDVHGNVMEWVQDCWYDSHAGAPRDGSAWESGDCSHRVLRGGSWYSLPRYLRAANRSWIDAGIRCNFAGFRVARTFAP